MYCKLIVEIQLHDHITLPLHPSSSFLTSSPSSPHFWTPRKDTTHTEIMHAHWCKHVHTHTHTHACTYTYTCMPIHMYIHIPSRNACIHNICTLTLMVYMSCHSTSGAHATQVVQPTHTFYHVFQQLISEPLPEFLSCKDISMDRLTADYTMLCVHDELWGNCSWGITLLHTTYTFSHYSTDTQTSDSSRMWHVYSCKELLWWSHSVHIFTSQPAIHT